jgi:hypothetical protein
VKPTFRGRFFFCSAHLPVLFISGARLVSFLAWPSLFNPSSISITSPDAPGCILSLQAYHLPLRIQVEVDSLHLLMLLSEATSPK